MPFDESDPDDPNELVGVAMLGSEADEEEMASCVIDEFVREGWDRAQILEAFRSPQYRLTHGVYGRRGEAFVTSLIDRVLSRWKEGTSCRP